MGWLFNTEPFPARWHCGRWSEWEGWTHIIADLAIFGAYFAIPLVIVYALSRDQLRGAPRIAGLFAAFILSCGVGHLIEAIIFWEPIYRVSGLVKVGTAVVSWATVAALLPLVRAISEKGAELQKASQFEEGAFSHSTIGMAYIALDATVIRVNPALCKIWQREESEILSPDFTWEKITPEPDLSQDLRQLQKLTAGVTESYTMDKRYTMPDGSRKWCRLTVWRVEDGAGKLLHYAINVLEIGVDTRLTRRIEDLDDHIERLS